MQFKIELKTIKAMLNFSADNSDARYYLRGIYVEFSPTETRVTATDGHILGVRREDRKDDNEGVGAVILDRDQLALLLKVKTHLPDATFTHKDGLVWEADVIGQTMAFTAVDAAYVNYRRIVAGVLKGWSEPETPAQFDYRLLARALKAGEALAERKGNTVQVALKHRGSDAAPFICKDIHGIVMPLRGKFPNAVLDGFERLMGIPGAARIEEASADTSTVIA